MDGDLLTVRERKGAFAAAFSSDECIAREALSQVMRALAFLHAAGIVHRDVHERKPGSYRRSNYFTFFFL